jgi:hypothetical protein
MQSSFFYDESFIHVSFGVVALAAIMMAVVSKARQASERKIYEEHCRSIIVREPSLSPIHIEDSHIRQWHMEPIHTTPRGRGSLRPGDAMMVRVLTFSDEAFSEDHSSSF